MKSATTVVAASLLMIFAGCGTAAASPINPQGQRLQVILDQMDVEHRWLAGVHIDWHSGEPDGRKVSSDHIATHCSAFVASAAEKLGIYILRPPQHPLVLLANAQYDWLGSDGAAFGWQPVADALVAQSDANRGMLVMAVYHNHRDDKPGHIAIIRPSEKSDADIQLEGPQIIQAGRTNHSTTSLQEGFSGHPAAWGQHEVRYYAHPIDWSALTSAVNPTTQ